MLSETAIDAVAEALMALRSSPDCGAWNALAPLSRLGSAGLVVALDLRASERIGVPVVFARPADPRQAMFSVLSERRRQVAGLVADGLSNKQIARALGISLGTVKDHVHDILTTLGYRSRAEIIAATMLKT